MNLNKFLLFAGITSATVGLAFWIAGLRAPERAVEKTPAFPGLIDRVNEVARVELRGGGKETVIVKSGSQWVVANRGNYPAQFEKVKPLVVGVAQLEILEQKTSNPELYAKLGVEDLTAKDAVSHQVSLLDTGGKTVAALLVGKEPANLGVQAPDALYIRRAGEAQALLVLGRVKAETDPAAWVDTKLADVVSSRIKEAVVKPAAGEAITISKAKAGDKAFTLAGVPKGMKVKSQGVVESLATALQDLHFEDVVAEADAKFPDKPAQVSYKTFDGLVAKATVALVNARTHVRFEFAFDPAGIPPASNKPKPAAKEAKSGENAAKPSVAEEAKRLNDLVHGWVYILPEFKGELFRKTLADLVSSAKEDKLHPPPELAPGAGLAVPESALVPPAAAAPERARSSKKK
jgi:hypothetical protein